MHPADFKENEPAEKLVAETVRDNLIQEQAKEPGLLLLGDNTPVMHVGHEFEKEDALFFRVDLRLEFGSDSLSVFLMPRIDPIVGHTGGIKSNVQPMPIRLHKLKDPERQSSIASAIWQGVDQQQLQNFIVQEIEKNLESAQANIEQYRNPPAEILATETSYVRNDIQRVLEGKPPVDDLDSTKEAIKQMMNNSAQLTAFVQEKVQARREKMAREYVPDFERKRDLLKSIKEALLKGLAKTEIEPSCAALRISL